MGRPGQEPSRGPELLEEEEGKRQKAGSEGPANVLIVKMMEVKVMKLQKALMVPLILLAAFAYTAASDELSGDGIKEEVGEAFAGESIFEINRETGMSPGVGNDSIEPTPATSETPWSNVAGRWTLSLVDSATRTVDLTLFQYGNEVFGKGIMTTGVNTQELTAAGLTEGSALTLRLVTVGGNSMYRLRTAVNGNRIFGTYTAYTSDGAFWAGNCDGNRFFSTPQTESDGPTGTVQVGMAASGGTAMS